jgi:hypothetical protein
MNSLQSITPTAWLPDRQPTKAQAVLHQASPTLAVTWVAFTVFHASVVLSGFGSQPSVLWPLLGLYAAFFAMGWRLLAGHLRWWVQGLWRGLPVLLSQPVLRDGQAQIVRLQGFKVAAQRVPLHVQWLHERGTLGKGGEAGVRWHEAWRSESVVLHWVPNVDAELPREGLQAQATLVAPPVGAGSRASLMARWSLLVVPADAANGSGVHAKLDALQHGWRFALLDSASATMGFAAPVVLQHLKALDNAQAQARAARVADAMRVLKAPWFKSAASWLPACALAMIFWGVFGDSLERLWLP